jgi:acetoin utilization deacetylase AcuC-like enzyme
MRRVGIAVLPEGAAEHETGPTHPERPERIGWIFSRLRHSGLLGSLVPLEARPASEEWITEIHDPGYVRRVERSCRRGARVIDSMDTAISEGSYDAARLASGAALALCDAVVSGQVEAAFAPVRPPGHHAERDLAMGFCLFNSVAIAARYLQKRHGLRRILIVDWDVHHGNGTQHAFEDDPDVLYFSTHQYPHYPGTGAEGERGRGRGAGLTVNVPMPAGAGDGQFRRAFEDILAPAALEFRPEAILISAGFDAHRDDPLSDLLVSDGLYAEMTRLVRSIASEVSASGIVSLLEGGYHPEAMPRSVEAHLRALQED